jgi:uncharacterized protein
VLAIIAIPAGLLIGLSLGALGGGGSILTVPALVYLLHQQPHAATTASLLIVGITALAGMTAHWRAGRLRLAQGITFGVLGVAGSYAGSMLSASIRPDLLLTLFAVLMLVAAAAMLSRLRRAAGGAPAPAAAAPSPGSSPAIGAVRPVRCASSGSSASSGASGASGATLVVTLDRQAPPASPTRQEPAAGGRGMSTPAARQALKVAAAATGVGLLTGFFGVGGGFVIVPALVLALGFEMPIAVGTSLLVISVNSASALAARLGTSVHLDWPLIGMFTLAALAGTLGGNRVAARVSASKLTTAFTVLLIVVAVYTLSRSLPA